MIAAAHASCFSMALSANLGGAGFKPESISTSAKVKIEKQEGGWEIVEINLATQGKVPGISAADFAKAADSTKSKLSLTRSWLPHQQSPACRQDDCRRQAGGVRKAVE